MVTTAIDGTVPATARWELIQQVTTSHKCERHPAWNIPNDSNPGYGDSSRVTTCHVLRNRINDQTLDANSKETGYAVTTTSQVDHDAYWILSHIVPATPITLQNAAFSRYLADADGMATTAKSVSSSARWILTDVGGGCAPLADVQIDSHQQGEIVDTTEAGNATGSFVLFGAAPPGTTSIRVDTDTETGHPTVEQSECALGWSIEVAAVQSQRKSFAVVATGPFGERRATIDLDVIAPTETDVLVQPTFANTPQFHGLLISYDEAAGTLVFAGDVSNEIDPGDGLGGGVSAIAPNGYLRIVLTTEFDGTNTVVTTRQAGITEFVRQIDIHYESDAEPVDVMSSEPVAESTSEPTDPSFSETAPPGVEVGASREPEAEDGGGLRPAEGEPAMASSNALAQLVPIGDDAELDLELIVDPGADFDLDIGWERSCWYCLPAPTVETFAFEVSLDLSAEVEFVYRGATLFEKSDNFGPRFDDFRFATISVPTPIGVPIVVTFEAESQPFYEISVDAVARIQYALTFRITAGFEHKDDGTGRGAYRDASFAGDSPSLDFDLGILATVAAGLEVDVEGLLYGQAGIELEARPQIELEAIGDLIDREVAWEVKLVVPFEAGIEVEIKLGPVGWEAEIGDLEFLELSFILFSGTFGGDTETTLAISQTAPPGVFPGQQFAVHRQRGEHRRGDGYGRQPGHGAARRRFVRLQRAGRLPGGAFTIGELLDPTARHRARGDQVGDDPWRAPQEEGTELTNTVTATSENGPDAGPVTATVIVGLEGRCNPCGAASGGVGLRNRSQGTIEIAGLPSGATVTRAVLTWGILYSGAVPRDTITLAGTEVTADVRGHRVRRPVLGRHEHDRLRRRRHRAGHRERLLHRERPAAGDHPRRQRATRCAAVHRRCVARRLLRRWRRQQPGDQRLHVQHEHRRVRRHLPILRRGQQPRTWGEADAGRPGWSEQRRRVVHDLRCRHAHRADEHVRRQRSAGRPVVRHRQPVGHRRRGRHGGAAQRPDDAHPFARDHERLTPMEGFMEDRVRWIVHRVGDGVGRLVGGNYEEGDLDLPGPDDVE